MVNLPCRLGKARGSWKRTIFVAVVAGEWKQCDANTGCWGDRWGRLRLRKKAANFQKDLCFFLIFFLILLLPFSGWSQWTLSSTIFPRGFLKKEIPNLCFWVALSPLFSLSFPVVFLSLSLYCASQFLSLCPLRLSLITPTGAKSE